MAQYSTDLATAQAAAFTDLSQAANLKQFGGRVFYLDVKISALTPAANDTLYLVRIPKNARLIPELCSVDYTAPSTTAATCSIGHIYDDGSGSSTSIASALALGTAAGRKNITDSGTLGGVFTTPIQFTDDAWLYLTWTTVTGGSSHNETWHLAYTNG